MRADRWLLPEGVEEALPAQAWQIETARRQVLDLLRSWGYELIRTPFIEFLDSLLTGAGAALELETFTLVDQLSGRQMGVRADMTPQAARIDAHRLPRQSCARYCYVGSVLRTRPEGLGGTRTPLQIGAELFGCKGLDGDAEVIRLMLAMLSHLGVQTVHLDLGHVGIYRRLTTQLALSVEQEMQLFHIVQRKSRPDLDAFLSGLQPSHSAHQWLRALLNLNGGLEVLDAARQQLVGAGIDPILDEIQQLAQMVTYANPQVTLHVDLAEIHGYRYKTGIVFAAYMGGQARELARGGRYDGVGAVFGRERPATGFSADLNTIVRAVAANPDRSERIFAPATQDASLQAEIARLRTAGQVVVVGFADDTAQGLDCAQQFTQINGAWRVTAV